MTTITRTETTKVYRNWRDGAGGRVLTFDLMLEIPRSRKVDGLRLNSDILFEEKRYVVHRHEPIIGTTQGNIRLMLMAAGETIAHGPTAVKAPSAIMKRRSNGRDIRDASS